MKEDIKEIIDKLKEEDLEILYTVALELLRFSE